MKAQETAHNILIDLDAEPARSAGRCQGQPQLGLRRFMATTASMISSGPFGPGRRRRSGENNVRYFRSQHTVEMQQSVTQNRKTTQRES